MTLRATRLCLCTLLLTACSEAAEQGHAGDASAPDAADATAAPAVDAAIDSAPGDDEGTLAVPDAARGADAAPPSYAWHLPPGFPLPYVPPDNPMSAEKVELGRRLFYDTRLSGNQTYACATCHVQSSAFTDGRAQAIGSTGQVHPRSAMSLTNVGYNASLTWPDPLIVSLEQQAYLPMFNDQPVELGLEGQEPELFARLQADPFYQTLFPAAFPGVANPYSVLSIEQALASFERTLVSGNSPYDRYTYQNDATAMSASALRGMDLFFNDEALPCFECHQDFNFAGAVKTATSQLVSSGFHNTGLYNIGGTGAYPPDNPGLFGITNVPTDMGRFRAPTLRNLGYTAPYMHDGSAVTLDDVLAHYAAGGRTITSGPHAGVGSANPFKDGLVTPFTLTPDQLSDLKAFLLSLDDPEFVTDPRLGNPWE